MDDFEWDALVHPRGSLPVSVYWWRRLVSFLLVLALLIVVYAIVHGVGGGGGSQKLSATPTTSPPVSISPTSGPTPSTPSTPTGTASPTPTANPTVSCVPASLSLTVKPGNTSYAAGASPVFTATLSTSGAACSAPSPVQFVVTSGGDRYWSNRDCPANAPAGNPTPLMAKGSASASRTWNLTRTVPGCVTIPGATNAAAGTYKVVASWAGTTSNTAVFTLN